MKKLLFIISLLFFCGYCIKSYAQKEIYWFTDSVKTSTQVTQDISIALSAVADTNRLLMTALPQYQLNIEYAQSPSIARLLKKLPNSCAPNRVKTPDRLKDNIYSLPINISLGMRVYFKEGVQAHTLPKKTFNNSPKLSSLASLFTGKSTHILGVENGRSYGVFLDSQIAALEKYNLVIRNGIEATPSLVKMLLKDRIDYIIEYPFGINETLSNLPYDITLDSLRIANSTDYIVGYVACHKGVLGQEVIENVNSALQKLYRSYSFYQAHTRHIDEADLIDFNRAYQVVFKVTIPLKDQH